MERGTLSMRSGKLLLPLKKVKALISEYRITHADRVFVSFGENCLTDDILKRHNIKSFSTPYSSARSNIEYILQLEKAEFRDFVNPEYLEYGEADGRRVARLKKYTQTNNTYNPAHMKGFEFTHHDVLAEAATREKMQRRASRMLHLRCRELNIFYHSRRDPATDRAMLTAHLNELKRIYEERCGAVNVHMFTQIIIDDPKLRRMEHRMENGIHIYEFYVLNEWAGSDQEIFWARCDDDLIEMMIQDVRNGNH